MLVRRPRSKNNVNTQINSKNTCHTETKSFKYYVENIDQPDFVYKVTKGAFIHDCLYGFKCEHKTYWFMKIKRKKQHGYTIKAVLKLYEEINQSFMCIGSVDEEGNFMQKKTESKLNFKIQKSDIKLIHFK